MRRLSRRSRVARSRTPAQVLLIVQRITIQEFAYSGETSCDFLRKSHWPDVCVFTAYAWRTEANRLHSPQRCRSVATLRRNHQLCDREARMAQPRSLWPHLVESTMVTGGVAGVPDGERSGPFREVPQVRIGSGVRNKALWVHRLEPASDTFLIVIHRLRCGVAFTPPCSVSCEFRLTPRYSRS